MFFQFVNNRSGLLFFEFYFFNGSLRITDILFCLPALECPEGQVYETCGNLCDRTCQALSGAEAGCDGDRLCEEGCFCPPGKYLSDTGECVTADQCPCLHDGQLYQPGDVYADHKSIWLVTAHA